MFDLRLRLLLGFGALTGLIALLGAGAWALERSLWSETEELYQGNVVASAQLASASEALWQLRYMVPHSLAIPPSARPLVTAEEEHWRGQLARAIDAYARGRLTLEEQQALAHWREVSASYLAARPRFFELLAERQEGQAVAWRAGTTTPLGRASVAALNEMVRVQQEVGATRLAATRRMARLGIGALVAATLLSLALALTLAHRVSSSITAPLRTLTQLADRLAAGHVPARPTALARQDEIGRLGAMLDRVAAGLRSIVTRAQGAARRLDATALDVVSASRQLSDGASTQAARLDDAGAEARSIATALNELATTFDAVARRTSEYATAAEAGAQEVARTSSGLEAIRGASAVTQQTLRSALLSSERIGSIVESIQDIGAATHVLSLNASIEASRAGEAGRGFAVVAAEVRGLADRALGSAREIREIVDGLAAQLRAVQAAVTDSVAAAEGGVYAGQQVSRTFQGLQASSRDTHASVSRMNDVLADQVKAIRRTAALVEDVGALARAQQQAASAVHAQGEALRTVMGSLDQVLGQFDLEPDPPDQR